jgi:hypothetical protein
MKIDAVNRANGRTIILSTTTTGQTEIKSSYCCATTGQTEIKSTLKKKNTAGLSLQQSNLEQLQLHFLGFSFLRLIVKPIDRSDDIFIFYFPHLIRQAVSVFPCDANNF